VNLSLKLKILENFPTQADFAQSIGEHESFVSKIIRGRRELETNKQIKWAKALNSTPKELFNE
jgi:plasmid maintenance system antidote protein VapI